MSVGSWASLFVAVIVIALRVMSGNITVIASHGLGVGGSSSLLPKGKHHHCWSLLLLQSCASDNPWLSFIIIDAVVPASQVIDIAGVAAQVRMGRRPNNKTIYHRRSSFLVRGHAPAGIIVAIKGGRHHHRCGQGL